MSISRPGPDLGHLAGQPEQLVGLLAHGADDDDDLVAVPHGAARRGRRPPGCGRGRRPTCRRTSARPERLAAAGARTGGPAAANESYRPPARGCTGRAAAGLDRVGSSASGQRSMGSRRERPTRRAWRPRPASVDCSSAQMARRSSRRIVSTRPLKSPRSRMIDRTKRWTERRLGHPAAAPRGRARASRALGGRCLLTEQDRHRHVVELGQLVQPGQAQVAEAAFVGADGRCAPPARRLALDVVERHVPGLAQRRGVGVRLRASRSWGSVVVFGVVTHLVLVIWGSL